MFFRRSGAKKPAGQPATEPPASAVDRAESEAVADGADPRVLDPEPTAAPEHADTSGRSIVDIEAQDSKAEEPDAKEADADEDAGEADGRHGDTDEAGGRPDEAGDRLDEASTAEGAREPDQPGAETGEGPAVEPAPDLEPWPERKPLLFDRETIDRPSEARAQAAADLEAANQSAGEASGPEGPEAAVHPVGAEALERSGAPAGASVASSQTHARPDLEPRVHDIGLQLYAAMAEQGPAKSAASFVTGRSIQRRIMAQAMDDPVFKTQLFRFVDVYPSIRDSGDLVRHLHSYLGGVDAPRPLDRLVATDKRRLPSWAVARLTERGMQRMAQSLIAGRDATDALPTLKRLRRRHTGFTIDLLGEACLSEAEAEEYARRYNQLLDYLPPKVARWAEDRMVDESPYGPDPRVNISLKVSSLYSQIDPLDFEGSRRELVSALKPLFVKARDRNVFITLDIERFVHRDLTYAAFADLVRDPELRDYPHLGVVVQAYLRDSAEIVQGLLYLARDRGTPFTIRLVKGAYWDYETILAAQEHWPQKVFLEKTETDTQFERLARRIIDNWQWTRPALGTHNIRSIAVGMAAAEAAGLPAQAVEIQVLHGMADSIRRAAVKQGYRVREYVPVGELIPGMAYLVRRLLENTANESFLRLTFAQHEDVEALLAPPGTRPAPEQTGAQLEQTPEQLERAPAQVTVQTPAAAGPIALEAPQAEGHPSDAAGVEEAAPGPVCLPFQNEPHSDFSREGNREAMHRSLGTISGSTGREYPLLIGGFPVRTGIWIDSVNPARPAHVVGRVAAAGQAEADQALQSARDSFPLWRDTPAAARADVLFKAAAGMRAQRFELAALEVLEAGKAWREADADVCEAIDFLEYYGREMQRLSQVRQLSDVPGESDLLFYEPRGVGVVIAPWNFPLAIPAGMVSAALVAGNSVVFKPATPTPVLGYALVRILHEAGVPDGVLNYLPGAGSEIGDYLSADPRVDLIAFTGSLDVGLRIMQQAQGAKPGQRNIKRVITEMGGKNAIIVDTDADLDAAVEGVLISAFSYSGQKCSACSRVVVLDTIYDQFLRRLIQAAASLKTGDPKDPATRVGPVVSSDARDRILGYVETGKQEATLVLPDEAGDSARSAGVQAGTGSGSVAGETPAPTAGGAARAAVPMRAPEAQTTQSAKDEATEEGLEEPAAETRSAADRRAEESEAQAPGEVSPPDQTLAEWAADQHGPAPLTGPQDPPGDKERLAGGEHAVLPPEEVAAPDEQASARPGEAAVPDEQAGYFIVPHIFADVPPDAVIAQEEIFGPVLSVIRASSLDHALEIALGVRYGLTGGLYSRNPAHIARVAREFRVGNLYINRPITGAMVGRQPFGGSRMSGVGSKAGGPDYLLQFMEPRVVTENTVRRGFAPDVPPLS